MAGKAPETSIWQTSLTKAAVAFLLLYSPAASAKGSQLPEPPPRRMIEDSWPRLADNADGDCKLEIIGNGKFMRIRVKGLLPSEQAHFGLTNLSIKPIDWQIRGDARGEWSLIYLPMIWGNGDGTTRTEQSGGTVDVTVVSARCSLSATAPWVREIRVIP